RLCHPGRAFHRRHPGADRALAAAAPRSVAELQLHPDEIRARVHLRQPAVGNVAEIPGHRPLPLPVQVPAETEPGGELRVAAEAFPAIALLVVEIRFEQVRERSEEHTSELQSRENLVCRLLLEKKKKTRDNRTARDASRRKNSTEPSRHGRPMPSMR